MFRGRSFLFVIPPNEHLPWTNSHVDSAWHSHLCPIARFRRDESWLCSFPLSGRGLIPNMGIEALSPPLFTHYATQKQDMIVLFF